MDHCIIDYRDIRRSYCLVAQFFEYDTNGVSPFGDQCLCIFFEGGALTAISMNGGKTGLMVITVERYFKIVHAILHRKHYRNWMTTVGVAIPWVSALCEVLFPALGTSRVVDGLCERMGVWPNVAMRKVKIHRVLSSFRM